MTISVLRGLINVLGNRAKILIIDIETSPNLAYVWSKWKQNVGDNQFIEKSYLMSFAAKWLEEDQVIYEENRHGDDRKIVDSIFSLLDEADVVVAHNGDKFDLPTILGRGLKHGLQPPSPYQTVDTLKVAQRRFRFVSNTLSALCEDLGLTKKDTHKEFPGFTLWWECLRQNDAAWAEMKEYNIQDILSLEELYIRMRPYISNHASVSRLVGDETCQCPKCGSENVQRRGYAYLKSGLAYAQFRCNDCGGWGRSKTAEKTSGRNVLRNA